MDENTDIEYRYNDVMSLTRGLVGKLGVTPHVSSLDVLTRALECAGVDEEVVAAPTDYPSYGGRLNSQVECDQSFQRLVFDALNRCTNGALDVRPRQAHEWQATLSEAEQKELRHWRDSWPVLRRELEERDVLGEEPDWGKCADSGRFMWDWIDSFEEEVDHLEDLSDSALDKRVEHLFRALVLHSERRFVPKERSFRQLCRAAVKKGAVRTLHAMVRRVGNVPARAEALLGFDLPREVGKRWAEETDLLKKEYLVSLVQYLDEPVAEAKKIMTSKEYSLPARSIAARVIGKIGSENDIAFLRGFYSAGAPYEARCPFLVSFTAVGDHSLAIRAEEAAKSLQRRLGLPESVLMLPVRRRWKVGEHRKSLWDQYRNDPKCPKTKWGQGKSSSPFGDSKTSGENCN